MAEFWKLLCERGKANWKLLCEQFGMEPELPQKDERDIHLEPKLESLEEIDKLMRQPSRGAWHE
jgi:hypothetical protein